MKRINITHSENSENLSFNPDLGLHHAVLREQSVVDEFYMETISPADDVTDAVNVVDPIIILFNQQRLDNMGAAAAKAFLDSLVPRSNELSELRKQCSDDDLMAMMKSRHLQSPAEILSWCRYMNNNIELFKSEAARLHAQEQASEQTEALVTDNNVNQTT